MRYLIYGILDGMLALLTWQRYGWKPEAAVVFLLLLVLTAVAFIDAKTMEIPNPLVLAVLALAVLAACMGMRPGPVERLIGLFCVSVPMLLLTLAIPGAFGGGDIKLMAAAGAFLGWKLCLMAAFLAILAGGFYGIYLLAAKKKGKKDHFAFGPFLCAGIAAAIFWGNGILDWYLRLCGRG